MLQTQHNAHLLVTASPKVIPNPKKLTFKRLVMDLSDHQLDQRIKNADHKLFIDSFAGGGGASEGAEWAINRPVDIAINHNKRAIAMHKRNHPYTRHYNENVWDVDPIKATFGKHVGGMWFSPDCRHFSKAKGSAPVSSSVRGLAWIALRWAGLKRPDVIWLENVEEFKTWGPVKSRNTKKIDPNRKGETFNKWLQQLKDLGYEVEHRIQSCDRWGVPTSRKRFFLVARCDGKPIVWPEDTHGDEEGLKPRLSAAEHVIDWSLDCPSIFERKKELAVNTQRRIAKGLEKFVFNKAEPFIVTTNHSGSNRFRGQSINEPLTTRTKKNGEGLVTPIITRLGQTKWNGDNSAYDIKKPITTITRKNEHCLVAPILERSFSASEGADIGQPVQTLTTKNKTALVTAFLDQHKFKTSHLVKMRGTNLGNDMREPLATISSGGTHHAEDRGILEKDDDTVYPNEEACTAFLTKYYGAPTEGGHSVDNPIGTLTSKGRFGLVMVHGVPHKIVDICMRMLQPHELYAAHGFHDTYIIDEDVNFKKFTKADQTAMVGNSVPPRMAYLLIKENLGVVNHERV